jgi:hypothetical protein
MKFMVVLLVTLLALLVTPVLAQPLAAPSPMYALSVPVASTLVVQTPAPVDMFNGLQASAKYFTRLKQFGLGIDVDLGAVTFRNSTQLSFGIDADMVNTMVGLGVHVGVATSSVKITGGVAWINNEAEANITVMAIGLGGGSQKMSAARNGVLQPAPARTWFLGRPL